MSLRRALLIVAVLACLVPASAAASMKMLIGAAEDEGRNSDPAVARAKMDLAKAAGFDAIRITAIWAPGQMKVDPNQLAALQAAASAAVFNGIQVTVTVMPFGSRTTPLTATARRQFDSFAADVVKRVPLIHGFIIGNEPNINRYWLPQFGPNGEDVAATAYEQLLAQTYDAIKAVDKKAFDGTAQIGSKLPIIYDEYGVESQIPRAKARFYHGVEPLTTKPVPLSTQSDYYDEALTMAACQPTVQAVYLFHVTDETDLNRWQSGVYYADDTPKPSRAVVKQTIGQIRSGKVDCTQGPLIHENDGWVLVGTSAKAPRSTHTRTKKPTRKHPPKSGPLSFLPINIG